MVGLKHDDPETYACEDGQEIFVELQKNNREKWDWVRGKYTPKLIEDATEYAVRRNRKFALEIPQNLLEGIVEYFTEETWEPFKEKVTKVELEYLSFTKIYNYRLTMIVNRCRQYMRYQALPPEDNQTSLDNLEVIRLVDGEIRQIENRLIMRELVLELIRKMSEFVDDPKHVEIYLKRIMYGVSSEELGEQYGYSPSYIDNIVSKVKKKVKSAF